MMIVLMMKAMIVFTLFVSYGYDLTSVGNTHHLDVDPAPGFSLDADPDPFSHCDADLYPKVPIDADQKPPRLQSETPRLQVKTL